MINNPEYAAYIKNTAPAPQERYEILKFVGLKSFEASEAISRGELIPADVPQKKRKGE